MLWYYASRRPYCDSYSSWTLSRRLFVRRGADKRARRIVTVRGDDGPPATWSLSRRVDGRPQHCSALALMCDLYNIPWWLPCRRHRRHRGRRGRLGRRGHRDGNSHRGCCHHCRHGCRGRRGRRGHCGRRDHTRPTSSEKRSRRLRRTRCCNMSVTNALQCIGAPFTQ